MLGAIKQQLVETAIFDPLDGGFHTRKPQSRRRLRNRVVTLVGDPDHQRRLALMDGYHRIFSEDEASARPPETGEDQPGHHREERHAGEDFYRGDEMPVMGLRVHVAVTDGGQRLDRKVKKAERLISGDIGDWLVAEPIEKCEHRIENDEDRRRRAEEDRPAGGHCAVIAVGPNAVGEAAGFDFATPYANWVPSAIAVELHLFSAFGKADKP